MDGEVPSWNTLIRRYKNENIRYLSNNKRNIYKIMLAGVSAAVLSIFISFLSLPGTIYSYYLVLIFMMALFGPETDDKNYTFSVSLSMGVSSFIISIMLGFYILTSYTGHITIMQSLFSFSTTALGILIIMPIYSIFVSLFGVVSSEALSKLNDLIFSSDNNEDNVENKNIDKKESEDKNHLQKEKSLN